MNRRTAILSAAASAIVPRAFAGEPAPANPRSVRVAVFRHSVAVPAGPDALEATRDRNAKAMVASIEGIMARVNPKPKLLVFPVLQYTSSSRGTSGVHIDQVAIDLISKPLSEGLYGPVIAACRRHDCYVVTTVHEKTPQFPGKYFHTGVVMGPNGLVLRSPKAQVYSAAEITSVRDIADDYAKAFGEEAILPVAKTPFGTIGCLVESEAETMEAGRLLVSKGAEIIVHPSAETPEVPWLALKQAMGFQCSVYLATGVYSRLFTVKEPDGQWLQGASTIVGPDGKVVASVGPGEEGYAFSDLNLDYVHERRKAAVRALIPAGRLYMNLYRPT